MIMTIFYMHNRYIKHVTYCDCLIHLFDQELPSNNFERDMENLTEGNGVMIVNSTLSLRVPGFTSFNLLMLILILVPSIFLNIITLLGLILDPVSPSQIRILLGNIISAGILVGMAQVLQHLTAIVLSQTSLPPPNSPLCEIVTATMLTASGVRLVFSPFFSIVVYILIKHGLKVVKKKFICIALVIIWVSLLLLSVLILIPHIVGVGYVGGAACLPARSPKSLDVLFYLYVAIWIIPIGLTSVITTISAPLATLRYVNKNKLNLGGKDDDFKRAMIKLAVFVILGNFFICCGRIIPALASVVSMLASPTPVFVYVVAFLIDAALLPTPLLVLYYLKNTRKALKKLFTSCQNREIKKREQNRKKS